MANEAMKQALESRLAKLTARLGKIESELRDPGSKDWQERASEIENDEVLEQLSESERREIGEIRSALQRIREGTYTVCSGCGEPIAPRRLEALPYTSQCVACAS